MDLKISLNLFASIYYFNPIIFCKPSPNHIFNLSIIAILPIPKINSMYIWVCT